MILVVEDDDDLREGLVELLRDEGYSSDGAENGKVALERLREGMVPCLILLDLMMPEMTGDEFRQRQLAEPSFSSFPVVILSAMHDATRTARDLRAAACLTKPVQLDTLLSIVRGHCGSPSTR